MLITAKTKKTQINKNCIANYLLGTSQRLLSYVCTTPDISVLMVLARACQKKHYGERKSRAGPFQQTNFCAFVQHIFNK